MSKNLGKRKRESTTKSKAPPKKKSRILSDSDDDDFEENIKEEIEDDAEDYSDVEEEDMDFGEDEELDEDDFIQTTLPIKKVNKAAAAAASTNKKEAVKSQGKKAAPKSPPVKAEAAKRKISKSPVAKKTATGKETAGKRGKKLTEEEKRYDWLENVRDSAMRSPDDPLYNPRTLFIPKSEYQKLSPFEQQFWDIKREYFDTIVFFKKGKFYELYEMDAGIPFFFFFFSPLFSPSSSSSPPFFLFPSLFLSFSLLSLSLYPLPSSFPSTPIYLPPSTFPWIPISLSYPFLSLRVYLSLLICTSLYFLSPILSPLCFCYLLLFSLFLLFVLICLSSLLSEARRYLIGHLTLYYLFGGEE